MPKRAHGSKRGGLTAYCLHCKAKHRIEHPHETHTGKHWFIQGKCSKCHHDVSLPISHEMHGSGAVADILGNIPILGSFLGPIAGALGG